MWDVVQFVNLLACGIVQGTYTFEMVVVVPALRSAPMQQSALLHRWLFSHLPNRFMPLCGISGGLAGGALALFDGGDLSTRAQALYIIGFAFWTVTFVILAGYSRPLDKQITEWVKSDRLPADEYPIARRRWDWLMYTRGPCGLVGLSCFIIATLS